DSAGSRIFECGSNSSESYLPTTQKSSFQTTPETQTSNFRVTSTRDKNLRLVPVLQKPGSLRPETSVTLESRRRPYSPCIYMASGRDTRFARNRRLKACWDLRDDRHAYGAIDGDSPRRWDRHRWRTCYSR